MKLLFVVDDAFVARGPGVLVTPRITDDGQWLGEVTLKRPDGSSVLLKATLDVAHMRGSLAPYAMVRLQGVTLDDVPIGSEVWSE